MSTIMPGDFKPFLTPYGRGLIVLYKKRSAELENLRGEMFKVDTSENAFEGSYHMVGIPGTVPLAPPNTDVRYTSFQLGPAVYVVFPPRALAVSMAREVRDDDKTGRIVKMVAPELAEVANETKEWQAVQVLNNGFTTGAYPTIDNLPFFSTVHPLVQANTLTGATVFANRLPAGAALSIGALTTIRAIGLRNAAYSGRLDPIIYNTLWVAPEDLTLAEQIVASTRVLGSNNNDPNPFGPEGKYRLRVRMNPRFLPGQWYLSDGKGDIVYWDRIKDEFMPHMDWSSRTLLQQIYFRNGIQAQSPFGWFGVPAPA
jgi:hypothetical protein